MSPKAKKVPANVFIKGFKDGGIRAAKQGAERTAAVAAHVVNASPPPSRLALPTWLRVY